MRILPANEQERRILFLKISSFREIEIELNKVNIYILPFVKADFLKCANFCLDKGPHRQEDCYKFAKCEI